MAVASSTVTYSAPSGQVQAYLSRPDTREPRPGLVVVQEWWGLDEHIKDITRRFAAEGYVALAPDLYHGTVTAEPDEAQKLMMALDKPRAVQEVAAGVRWLRGQPACRGQKLATIGYCMGGALSLAAAIELGGELDACVIYYGRNPDPIDQVQRVQCPVLGIYGEADQGVPPAEVERLAQAMQRHGKSFQHHIYPGAPHAFFNDTRPQVYRAEAARDAWQKTLAFFAQHLQAPAAQRR